MQPAPGCSDPRRRPEPLQMRQRRRHRHVMRLQQPGVTGQRPPHRQRFRRQNVASNPATARTRRPSARYRSNNSRPNRDPETGSRPDKRASNCSTSTRPASPNPAACRARPHPRCLTRRSGQIAGVVVRRRRRRRRVDRRHPQHRTRTVDHRPPLGTCLLRRFPDEAGFRKGTADDCPRMKRQMGRVMPVSTKCYNEEHG